MIVGKPTFEQMEKVKLLLGEILYNEYKYERMEETRKLKEEQGEEKESRKKVT